MKDLRFLPGTQINHDMMMEPVMGNQFVQIRKIPQVSMLYDIYIADEIIVPAAYSDYFHILHIANEEDQVHLHLNTPGGDGDTMTQAVHQMRRCQAQVIAFAEGMVASAGTFLFLAADQQVVQQHSRLMIHSVTTGMYNKLHELKSQSMHVHQYWDNFYKDIYKGFLTKKEIKKVIDGHDFWMEADEIRERLQKRDDKREAEFQKVREAMEFNDG